MKRMIVSAAIVLAIVAFAATAQSHDPTEAALEELQEDCYVCCMASRPSVFEALRINEEACWTGCGSYVETVADIVGFVFGEGRDGVAPHHHPHPG